MQKLLLAPRANLLFSLTAVLGVVVFGLAVGVIMQPAVAIVGMERTSDLVCLQLAFTAARATEIVLAFPPESRPGIPMLLVPGDLALAWGYGLLLAGLTGLLALRLPGKWRNAGAIVLWVPLLASTLDCIENAFLYAIVVPLVADPGAGVNSLLPLLAGVVSSLKWIALCIVTPAFGFAGIIKGLSVNRSGSALLIYFLLFVVLLSMVAKPIVDIPACF